MSDWSDITRQILKERDASRFYSSILFRETVGSTNEWVRELAGADFPEAAVCIAEEQTAGRGRRGRAWESPRGENIYFSLLLRPAFAPERASALTLAMGLAVAQAVRSMGDSPPENFCMGSPEKRGDRVRHIGGVSLDNYSNAEAVYLPAGIKWPNDVVINHRKICGILTEMKADIGKIHHVCIGTGINVNQTEFAEELRDKATSLKLENGGRNVDRGRLLASVLLHFQDNYDKYCRTEDFSLLANDYNALLIGKDGQVRIEDPQRAYIATSRGIAADGALIVELADGTVQEIKSGEVSVRGLYGYV